MPLISAQTLISIDLRSPDHQIRTWFSVAYCFSNGKTLMSRLLVMLLLADVEDRPAFSVPWPRGCPLLAGGAMSTTMPTALLGSKGRDRVGDVDR